MNNAVKAITLALGLAVGSAHATVTLQFSQVFTGGIASNFSTAGGTSGVDGLRWGIIVDTTGNGFAGGGAAYDPMAAGPTTAAFMAGTDDYFFPATALTADYSGFLEGDGMTSGGPGTIDEIASVPFGTNGISLGDDFALIWFDSTTANLGDRYGFFTHGTFEIPADGSTSPFDTPFVGVDPVRNATNTFGAIPEPSRMMLLGFGLMGVLFRRRR